MQDALMAELRHPMNNDLRLVAGLVNVRLRAARGAEARRHLAGLHEEINALAVARQVIEEAGRSGPSPVLRAIARLWERVGRTRGIGVAVEAEDGTEVGQGVAVALAAHALVIGALEHAWPAGGAGRVEVRLMSHRRGRGMLIIAHDRLRERNVTGRNTASGPALVACIATDIGDRFEAGPQQSGLWAARLLFPAVVSVRAAI